MQEQEAKQDDISTETTQSMPDEEVESSSGAGVQPDDQTSAQETSVEHEEDDQADTSAVPLQAEEQAFDWFALGVVVIAAAVFALAGRLNAQPPTSLTPVAVLSALGCGLLATGLRKTRTIRRPGLLEAGLGGFALALSQFVAALTYPGIIPTLAATPDERTGFLTTWALIALLSVIFSMAGAALGHLAFAPLRPTPIKKTVARDTEPTETVRDAETIETTRDVELTETAQDSEQSETEQARVEQPQQAPKRARPWFSYAAAVGLLGLAPTLAGYMFAAAFDYMLGVYHFLVGPYPTLRLLSTLLPWQVPIPFDAGNGSAAALLRLVELWRIPLFLGNPNMFDVLALEPYVFTSAGLAVLLLTLRDEAGKRIILPWSIYLLLEGLLGLLLVLPADVWIMRGLEGLLRSQLFALPLRTLYILNTLTFVLNIVTGPVICLSIGVGLRVVFRTRGGKSA